MHDNLKPDEETNLREMIRKKRTNLEILEWLKDGLIRDFFREKKLVEDYESRYKAGKITNQYDFSWFF